MKRYKHNIRKYSVCSIVQVRYNTVRAGTCIRNTKYLYYLYVLVLPLESGVWREHEPPSSLLTILKSPCPQNIRAFFTRIFWLDTTFVDKIWFFLVGFVQHFLMIQTKMLDPTFLVCLYHFISSTPKYCKVDKYNPHVQSLSRLTFLTIVQ